MANLRDTRRRLSLVLIVLFSIDLAAAAVLLSPIGSSARGRREQLSLLWAELQRKTRDTAPLHGIDQKVVDAQKQIGSFFKTRLPGTYSAIVEQIGKVAAANGVKAANIRYDTDDTEVRDLQRVSMDVSVTGDYLNVVKFINELERDRMFFIVDGVSLGGQQASAPGQSSGTVRLQLRLETYLKSANAT